MLVICLIYSILISYRRFFRSKCLGKKQIPLFPAILSESILHNIVIHHKSIADICHLRINGFKPEMAVYGQRAVVVFVTGQPD